MQLPERADGQGREIGVSDILAWRKCPARAKFGRRRLTGKESPESWSPANSYGDAIHMVLSLLSSGVPLEPAVHQAFAKQAQWLEVADVEMLIQDAHKFLERQHFGVQVILSEGEISVPLFTHPEQGQIWLRGRIDLLLQKLDDPTWLTHVDYKSGKWIKSEAEVTNDIQLWTYNLLIYTWWLNTHPDIFDVHIDQIYDQLRFGQVPTHKGVAQREQIRRWLIAAITAMIEDEEEAPRWNEWCPWCPLLMDCKVIQDELTDWALTKIAALAPREERRNKDGQLSKRQGPPHLDPDRIAEYVEVQKKVKRAHHALETFDELLVGLLKQLPAERLIELHRSKVERTRRAFTYEAKRELIGELGLENFLMLCDLSLAAVERYAGDDKGLATRLQGLATSGPSYTIVTEAKE